MNTNINVDKIMDYVAESILDQYYFLLTDEFLVKDGQIDTVIVSRIQNESIEVFIELKYFILSTRIGKNPFLKAKDLDVFTKTILRYQDLIGGAVAEKLGRDIKNKLKNAKQKIEEAKRFCLKPVYEEEDNNQDGIESIQKFQKAPSKIQPLRSEWDNVYLEGKSQLKNEFTEYFRSYWYKILKIFNKAESSLEEAFLIGIIAYEPFGQNFLTSDSIFDSQVKLNKYRLDFVYKEEVRNIKIGIELNAHNYKQSLKKAVKNSSKEGVLIEKDWRILRFNENEIKTDLEECIMQVKRLYDQLAREVNIE